MEIMTRYQPLTKEEEKYLVLNNLRIAQSIAQMEDDKTQTLLDQAEKRASRHPLVKTIVNGLELVMGELTQCRFVYLPGLRVKEEHDLSFKNKKLVTFADNTGSFDAEVNTGDNSFVCFDRFQDGREHDLIIFDSFHRNGMSLLTAVHHVFAYPVQDTQMLGHEYGVSILLSDRNIAA